MTEKRKRIDKERAAGNSLKRWLRWMGVSGRRELDAEFAAIDKSQAIIQFGLDGRVLTANQNFLKLLGYTLDEIKGQHHSLFVTPEYRASAEYQQFWDKLGRGEYDAGQYKRIGKNGIELWLQASYNPIFDPDGRPYKVVKYASDVSEQVKMSAALRSIVDQVDLAVSSAKTSAAEIANGNADLAVRTEQQAASLEETASAMEELTGTVKQTADNARQVSQLAVSASGLAERGGAAVGDVVRTMDTINESSRKIVDIIGVIDGIAFQTNILALNAAVEAARAGDQGRGFAVVASEVRGLAHRSATAAKEIKGLIEQSVQRVAAGTQQVTQAGATIDEVVSAVRRVTDIIAEISAATQEQSSGITQINDAVAKMDEGTQQNAALVEETSAASQALDQQVAALLDSVRLAIQTLNGSQPEPAASPKAEPDAVKRSYAGPERRKPSPGSRMRAAVGKSRSPVAQSGSTSSATPMPGDPTDQWQGF